MTVAVTMMMLMSVSVVMTVSLIFPVGMVVPMIVSMFVFVMMVIMPMMVRVIMMVMMMRMVRVRARAIGLERRGERRHLGGGTGEQCLDLGVAAQSQPVGEDLHRHMAVAELPRRPRERRRVGDARLDQRFRVGHDLDEAAVVEHQHVVGRERRRIGKVELDAGALAGEEEALLGLALREIENKRVGGAVRARLAGSQDFGGARHRRFRTGSVETGRPLVIVALGGSRRQRMIVGGAGG